MKLLADPSRRLRLLLRLVAAHSLAVGLALVLAPADVFVRLGYAPLGERFFPVQGGVFHIVMAAGYLMAARDLSVINTPPPNRYPIESRVIRFDEEAIRDAVSYEIQREGQVFFVHNRIENIREVAGMQL